MKNKASESGSTPYGANVLDHNGNDIGDRYSVIPTTTIKTKDGKAFLIYAPSTSGCGHGGSSGSGSGSGGGSGGGQ